MDDTTPTKPARKSEAETARAALAAPVADIAAALAKVKGNTEEASRYCSRVRVALYELRCAQEGL